MLCRGKNDTYVQTHHYALIMELVQFYESFLLAK